MVRFELGKVSWTDDEMRDSFSDFRELYSKKPIADNKHGMKAPHAFLAWFLVRKISPTTVIESGVYKGQGTWLIENACPSARILCIDPNLSQIEHRAQNATYYDKDFSFIDFSGIDKENALCFFDDHQCAYDRVMSMKWKGFKRAIFEDNYPPQQGDTYSLRKVLAASGFEPDFGNTLLGKVKLFINKITHSYNAIPPNNTHRKELLENLCTYWEGPPLYRPEITRWGDKWSDESYPTKQALFNFSSNQPLASEAQSYTWLCFVELK